MSYNPMYDAPVVATPAEAPMMASQPSSPMMFDNPSVAREVAQVQGQILVAKKFPRDINLSMQKIERACSRATLANSALYSYSRGGSDIRGVSIRLAEELAKDWGNIKYGFEPIDSTADETTVRCFAYDMEENVIVERSIKVPHIRHTSHGDKKLTDPRDIYETVANQATRRVRACILELIPGDIVDHAVEMCAKTQASTVKITPENLDKLCDAFASFGVAKVQIECFIQRKIEAVTIDQYIRLRNIYHGLKDGVSRVSDFFKTLDEAMAERGEKPATVEPTPSPAPAPEQAPATTEPQQTEEGKLPGFDF